MIRNISDTVKSVGPWEVTRVPCGGLAFFPGDGGGDLCEQGEMNLYL